MDEIQEIGDDLLIDIQEQADIESTIIATVDLAVKEKSLANETKRLDKTRNEIK